jgi:predicted DCC family thiol-disulfide oxidoreductase YuxK
VKLKEVENLYSEDSIVIFDGECSFCNSCVNLLMKLDKSKKLKFSSSTSKFVQIVEKNYPISLYKNNSIIFIHNSILYYRSDAVIKILNEIKYNQIIVGILKLIPKFIRDACYNFISNHRYILNKNIKCKLPSEEDNLR